jgi:hypothetical protein
LPALFYFYDYASCRNKGKEKKHLVLFCIRYAERLNSAEKNAI